MRPGQPGDNDVARLAGDRPADRDQRKGTGLSG